MSLATTKRALRIASRRFTLPLASLNRYRVTHPSPLRQISRRCPTIQSRLQSTAAVARPLTDQEEVYDKLDSDVDARKAQTPAYDLTFTCKKCEKRSTHRITKQGYHSGTVLITCPECKNRHLIADHLKIFSDKGITIEDILREKGEYLKKGRVGEGGDIEFYNDANQVY